jgi:hypothetical protein
MRTADRSVLIFMAVLTASISFAGPATQPASRPALGEIDIEDYCTVLLASKLQDKLNATDDQRSNLSDLKTQLKSELDMAAGGDMSNPSPGFISARAHHILNVIGHQVRRVLTPAQDQALAEMFDDKTLESIQVESTVEHSGSPIPFYRSQYVAANVRLIYTHYGETNSHAFARERSTTRSAHRMMNAQHVNTDDLDIPSAINLLSSDDAETQASAARQLGEMTPDDAHRAAVIAALKPHLSDPIGRHRLMFVEAFVKWSQQAQVPDLIAIVDYPRHPQGLSGNEKCWAAAVAALVRLSPSDAYKAVDRRIDSFFFREAAKRNLEPMTSGDDATAKTARRLIEWLEHPDEQPNIP